MTKRGVAVDTCLTHAPYPPTSTTLRRDKTAYTAYTPYSVGITHLYTADATRLDQNETTNVRHPPHSHTHTCARARAVVTV